MVRAMEEEKEDYKSKLFHFKGMYDTSAGRHSKSTSFDSGDTEEPTDDNRIAARSHLSGPIYDRPLERQKIGSTLNKNEKGPKLRLNKDEAAPTEAKDKQPSGKSHLVFVIIELHATFRNFPICIWKRNSSKLSQFLVISKHVDTRDLSHALPLIILNACMNSRHIKT